MQSLRIPSRKMFHGYSYTKNEPMRLTGKEWMALAERLQSPMVKLHGLNEVKFKHHEVYLDGTDVYYK